LFYDTARFPFVELLEANWRSIKEELCQFGDDRYRGWNEGNYSDAPEKWTVLPLYNATDRQVGRVKSEENCERCPRTMAILDSIEGVQTAGVSRFGPHTWVKTHCDPGWVLRCHLGLVIPKGCGICVNGHTRVWREGKCLLINTEYLHDAWNWSGSDRLVMLLDVDPRALPVDLNDCAEIYPPPSRMAAGLQRLHYATRTRYSGVRRQLAGLKRRIA
jgi:beta-hydroxylase